MSETPHNSTTVATTEQVQSWLAHDKELFANGATIDHLGNLAINNEQYDQLHSEMSAIALPEESAQKIVSVESERISNEQLKGYIHEGAFVATPYIGGQATVTFNKYDSKSYDARSSQKTNIISKMLRGNDKPPKPELATELSNAGVSELVTIAPLEEFLYGQEDLSEAGGQLNMNGERLLVLHYKTLKAFEDHVGRPVRYNYAMALPESTATTLFEAMKSDPSLARRAGDELIKSDHAYYDGLAYGSPHGWNKWQPPYEKWKEDNGGVQRMAFRNGYHQPIAQAKIVEF